MKLAMGKQNLDSFKKAQKGMQQNMKYQLAKAAKKISKNAKGDTAVRDNFLRQLNDLCSFEKEKIPTRILKKLAMKEMNSSQKAKYWEMTKMSLKKSDQESYLKMKVCLVSNG